MKTLEISKQQATRWFLKGGEFKRLSLQLYPEIEKEVNEKQKKIIQWFKDKIKPGDIMFFLIDQPMIIIEEPIFNNGQILVRGKYLPYTTYNYSGIVSYIIPKTIFNQSESKRDEFIKNVKSNNSKLKKYIKDREKYRLDYLDRMINNTEKIISETKRQLERQENNLIKFKQEKSESIESKIQSSIDNILKEIKTPKN